MSEAFKGRAVAPPVEKRSNLVFASGMNQSVPSVPASAMHYTPNAKQSHQGSLQHKRAHMHRDKARLK